MSAHDWKLHWLIGVFGPDELRNLMTRAFFGQDYDIDERTRITWTSHMEGDIEE